MRRKIIKSCAKTRRYLEKVLFNFQQVKKIVELEASKIKGCRTDCREVVEDGKCQIYIRFFDDTTNDHRSFKVSYLTDSFNFSDIEITNTSYYQNKRNGGIRAENRNGHRDAYIIPIDHGKLLVTYRTVMGFFDEKSGICYLQPYAYKYGSTVSTNIYYMLSHLGDPVIHFVRLPNV